MPIIHGHSTDDGCLIQIQIGFSRTAVRRMRSLGLAIPIPIEIPALIDPGADVTAVDPASIFALSLPLVQAIPINAPAIGGFSVGIQRDASIRFIHPVNSPSDDLVVHDTLLAELPLNALGYQALIGRDMLARCLFILDGPSRTFNLSY